MLTARTALMRENAKVVGTEAFSNIQEAQIAFFDGQLAAWKGDYKTASKLAQKTSDLVAVENNARKNGTGPRAAGPDRAAAEELPEGGDGTAPRGSDG